MGTIRTYSELSAIPTFDGRFEYLKLQGEVGHETFGFDRYLNQKFYKSREWTQLRSAIIVRDQGCDLGVPGHEIQGAALVHHINPVAATDLLHNQDWVLNPEYLILTCHDTHNAIHYANPSMIPKVVVDRAPGDTKLW